MRTSTSRPIGPAEPRAEPMADRFLVVQDNEDILYSFPTLAEASRTLADLLIERLDHLRQRAVRPLSMHN
jgi:hypothetical protein